MNEYKCRCDLCKKSGGPTFATVYYEPIDGKWVFMCKKCWEAVEKFKKKH